MFPGKLSTKKPFQVKVETTSASNIDKTKKEEVEILNFENETVKLIPKDFLDIFEEKKYGCPSETCPKENIYDSLTLGLHWKKRHLESIPNYYCPIYGCLFDDNDKDEMSNHLKLYHRDEASISKVYSHLVPNKNYIKPVLPTASSKMNENSMHKAIKRPFSFTQSKGTDKGFPETTGKLKKENNITTFTDAAVSSKKGSSPFLKSPKASNESMDGVPCTKATDDNIIPKRYMKVWTEGKGCPCDGCKGNRCQFTKYAFKSHWKKFHEREVQVVICPDLDCKRTFRSVPSFEKHASTSHQGLSHADIENPKTKMCTNEKYVKPKLPEQRLESPHKDLSPQGRKVQKTADIWEELEESRSSSLDDFEQQFCMDICTPESSPEIIQQESDDISGSSDRKSQTISTGSKAKQKVNVVPTTGASVPAKASSVGTLLEGVFDPMEDLELPSIAAKFWQKATKLKAEAEELVHRMKWIRTWTTWETINKWVNKMRAPPEFMSDDLELRKVLKEAKIQQAKDTIELILGHYSSEVKEKSEEANLLLETAKTHTFKLHPKDGGDRINKAEMESLIDIEKQMEGMTYEKKAPLSIDDIMNVV